MKKYGKVFVIITMSLSFQPPIITVYV